MDSFRRRVYHGPGELLADLRAILADRDLLRAAMRGGLDAAFRERLMLVVTGVNGCRYCSYAHARQALVEGISPEEIARLGDGTFHGSPSEELPALLYAQHWAETDGAPDAEARTIVEGTYGKAALAQIEIVLRMIRVGNLLGNTWDYVLHRLTLGRLGGD
jgi:AhpD family alkylhydroperoxidase